mgnify:FL=1
MKRIEKMHKFVPPSLKIVFEFRDVSWFIPIVYNKFQKMKWCISGTYILKEKNSDWMGTMPEGLMLPPRTSSFNYVRIHGNRGYKGSLKTTQMKELKRELDKQEAEESFIMFNNAFFDPRSNHCFIDNTKVRYAAVCNAVEFSSLA